MRSYTDLLQLYQDLTNNTDASNQTLGVTMMNNGVRDILGNRIAWKFLEESVAITTVSSQADYQLPYDYGKTIALESSDGGVFNALKQIKDRDSWNTLNDTSLESDYIRNYYLNSRTVSFYPVPATSSNTINLTYTKRVRDISNADYTTGTVSITNDTATVTGSGTTFTAAMVGRFIKVNADGFWYKITAFTSTTVITIEDTYQGTTVSGGAFTIGEMTLLPEEQDIAPVFYAAWIYYSTVNTDTVKAGIFKEMYLEHKQGLKDNNMNSSYDLGSDGEVDIVNPNDFPSNLT